MDEFCAAGRQKAVPAALYCALGAGGLHFLTQRLQWDRALRRTLVRMDLLDDEGHSPTIQHALRGHS